MDVNNAGTLTSSVTHQRLSSTKLMLTDQNIYYKEKVITCILHIQ